MGVNLQCQEITIKPSLTVVQVSTLCLDGTITLKFRRIRPLAKIIIPRVHHYRANMSKLPFNNRKLN